MNVICPQCSSRYLLPAYLMGEGGARVRCPVCQTQFVVPPEPATSDTPAAEAEAQVDAPAEPAPAAEATVDAPIETPPAPNQTRADSSPEPPAPIEARRRDPLEVARAVVEELSRDVDAMREAQARGHLLAEHGTRLIAAFDTYRREAGPDARAVEFRAALRERWGIDLPAGLA